MPSLLHTHTTSRVSLGFSTAAGYCACPPSGLTLFYYKCNQVYANKHSACWKNSPTMVGTSRNINKTNKQKTKCLKCNTARFLDQEISCCMLFKLLLLYLFIFGSAVIVFSCCGVHALIFVTFVLLVFAYLQCFFLLLLFVSSGQS